jgi:predicted  nucleic acid-binding Zn-ribbon protein
VQQKNEKLRNDIDTKDQIIKDLENRLMEMQEQFEEIQRRIAELEEMLQSETTEEITMLYLEINTWKDKY